MSIKIKPRKELHELVQETQIELDTYLPNIIICGKSPCPDVAEGRLICGDCPGTTRLECMYDLRQRIKLRLIEENCLATTPEENIDPAYASMDEKLLLRKEEIDLIFIIPTSEGSISELSSFADDMKILPKLRVLVPSEFHPFYGPSESYTTSKYLELMSDYGHVYPFDINENFHPDPLQIVSSLVSVYKRRKLLELTGIKNKNP